MRAARRISSLGLGLLICGCQSQAAHQPATLPAQSQAESASPLTKQGFMATCPTDWKMVNKGGDFAFAAVPKGTSGADDDPTVAIQVPSLPPHIPGFIPLGGVAGGYVDDLKKRYPDQKVDEKSGVKLDSADARRVLSSFQNNGKAWRELAVLAVHGDHVYVITGNCDASAFDKTKLAFDALVSSVKWSDKS